MSLTPLYVPPPRPSPRPPGEPLRRPEPPVLHRHHAAAIDAERSRLAEERRAFEKEREAFRQQQAAARDSEVPARARAPEQIVHDTAPKRRVDAAPTYKLDVLLPTDAKALAARIVEMGRVVRCEIPYRGTEPTLPMAKMIVAAAAKARSIAPPPELPEMELAKAIVLSAAKARGTIDAAGDRFLSDYFGKLEATRELMR